MAERGKMVAGKPFSALIIMLISFSLCPFSLFISVVFCILSSSALMFASLLFYHSPLLSQHLSFLGSDLIGYHIFWRGWEPSEAAGSLEVPQRWLGGPEREGRVNPKRKQKRMITEKISQCDRCPKAMHKNSLIV